MKVQALMTGDLGRQPTKKELASAVEMTEIQLERCLTAMGQRCYSLDQQITNPLKPNTSVARQDTMYDLIESKKDDRDYNKQTHMFLREDLISMLKSNLSEEEVYLLLLRYGLVDDSTTDNLKHGALTIAEVSRLVGYKPDKVRRIINRSLTHMKAVIGNEWVEYERELQ
jgi:DNA-directed RNA polymerase sigma subunit (sigma70/sigma32)